MNPITSGMVARIICGLQKERAHIQVREQWARYSRGLLDVARLGSLIEVSLWDQERP
jgi:hypothetical protein